MQDTLRQCEREVETSRAKLASDLAILRSPKTLASFTDDLKQDAMQTKDELVSQAKDAVQSKMTGIIEEMKAKAAANPAAALMIGAGLGWYFLRHPPVTTALVGLGLYSLLRTPASAQPHAQTRDYLRQGQERLKIQAAEFASQTAEQATTIATEAGEMLVNKSTAAFEAAKENADELFEAAKDSVRRYQHGARDKIAMGAAAVRDEVSSIITKAGAVTSSGSDSISRAADKTATHAARTFDNFVVSESRDRILLGIAGLAVAAALGMAYQKRIAQTV